MRQLLVSAGVLKKTQITYILYRETGGTIFRQSTAIMSVLRNHSAPSGLVIGTNTIYLSGHIHTSQYDDNSLRLRESSTSNRTCPWCPKPQRPQKAVTTLDDHGCGPSWSPGWVCASSSTSCSESRVPGPMAFFFVS